MISKRTLENRILVVSNRLPVTLKKTGGRWRAEKSAGGLTSAMAPLLERSGGLWIGWSGDSSPPDDGNRRQVIDDLRQRKRFIAVDLPVETARGFYEGFSNETLWFLFHNFPSLLRFRLDDWRSYVEANRLFCDAVMEHLQPGDIIWVHDYQLLLLPSMIRERAPDARIGFFLHIPFPAASIFRILPHREELLQGMLGADYIGFHTHRYLQNFRASMLRVLGLRSQMSKVEYGDRSVRFDAQPIGIAAEEFERQVTEPATQKRLTKMRDDFADRKLLLAVDRLDYIKGIPHRMQSYRELLRRNPQLHGRVTLIQVAVPSRERVKTYKELRSEVDNLVGQINGEFGMADWTPIIYLRRNVPLPELVALYALADVAWISPLRDGFNLVAKEYVACNPNGLLVLSEFAGAASEMGEALFVNPYDIEATAETIARALELPSEERTQRIEALRRRVKHNNVYAWGEQFISNILDSVNNRSIELRQKPAELPAGKVVEEFERSSERILLLDYDGTLVGYADRPQDAVPTAELLALLQKLVDQPRTCVALVSGRTRQDLEKWFGGVKGIWLAAEHGAAFKPPRKADWSQIQTEFAHAWRGEVRAVLEHFADRTPGSLIEEKEFSLVWHYRMSDPEFGEWLAKELIDTLDRMLVHTPLRAVHGEKIVEVKFSLANKGEIYQRLRLIYPETDFILAAGDDTTDEALFARLPATAWSVHIGSKPSRARFRLSSPDQMLDLLTRLSNVTESHVSRSFAYVLG